jgi:hypothetical protein
LCANDQLRPQSSRVNGCVFSRAMRPRFARLMWQMTIRLLIGYPRMNRAISEWALGAGSWNVRHPLPSYRAIPQPSRCGPVAPPRRINPAKLKRISVGTLESIPSNSHKPQALLRSVCDRWQANGHIASPLMDCTVGLEDNEASPWSIANYLLIGCGGGKALAKCCMVRFRFS